MSKSKVIIVIIWLFILGDSLRQGISIPSSIMAQTFPAKQLGPLMLTFPFVFFLVVAFLQRKHSFNKGWFHSFFDNKYGQGSTERFTKSLRPVTLIMSAATILGVSGIFTTFNTTQEIDHYILSGFFLSGGLGLFGAYLLSLKFPPRLN